MTRARCAVLLLMALPVMQAQIFAPTGSMSVPRVAFTATLLNNGLVLVTGGFTDSANDITNSAELYDPAKGTWRYTGIGQQSFMVSPRVGHTATKLADGRVLLASGVYHMQPNSGVGGFTALLTNSAEIFDPITETFTPAGSLNFGRSDHAAVLLSDGRVLVAGGSITVPNVETYDPNAAVWTSYNNDDGHGADPAVARLTDGRVLITGGGLTSRVDLFDPSTNSFLALTPMLDIRSQHSASVVPNGKVLIASGRNGSASDYTAELYDATANSGSGGSVYVPGSLTVGGYTSSAALLPDGDVLLAGGQMPPGDITGSTSTVNAQLYSFASNSLASLSPLSVSRANSPMTVLATGQVLICGGVTIQGGSATILTESEVWGSAATGTINVTTNLSTATFAITGPATYGGGGTSFSQSNATVGSYTITYGAVTGYATPSSQMFTLSAGGTIAFSGTYQPLTGTISVTTNNAAATFTITGPATYGGGGASFTQSNAPIGSYTVTYGAVAGYVEPPSQTLTLATGGTISFSGTYVVTSGTGTITISSVPSGAGFQLSGPGLTHYSGSTPFKVTMAPSGNYTITWDILLGGYQTPQSQMKTLAAGGTTAFSGHYAFTLQALPASLAFTAVIGQPPPSAQTIQISSSGGPLLFNASPSTNSGGNWLAASPKTSTTPQSISVAASVDAVIRGLSAGTYSGTITINSPAAANTPVVVPVSFSVLLPAQLTLQPSSSTSNTGQPQAFTATLTSVGGPPIVNRRVTLTVTGQNPTTLQASTNAMGIASFSYVGVNTGADTVTASATVAGVEINSNAATITWTLPPPPLKLNIVLPPDGVNLGRQPLPGEITLWQRALALAAGERQGLEGGTSFPSDLCYFGAMDATAVLASNQALNPKILINDIVKDAQSLTPLLPLSAAGQILVGTTEFLIQAGTSSQPDADTLKFLTEKTVGFMLSQAAGQYNSGVLDTLIDQVSATTVNQLVQGDGMTTTKPSNGSNSGSNYGGSLVPTSVDVQLSYNPFSHYMAAGIHASCHLPSGATATGFYTFGIQLDARGLGTPGSAFACDPSPSGPNVPSTPQCKPVPDYKYQ